MLSWGQSTPAVIFPHFNKMLHPSISQLPASNFYPQREALWTTSRVLSATHLFSVAQIKDLPGMALSYMSHLNESAALFFMSSIYIYIYVKGMFDQSLTV